MWLWFVTSPKAGPSLVVFCLKGQVKGGNRMRVTVPIEVTSIRAGFRARAESLGLAGHGEDVEDALESLRKTVLARLTCANRRGRLERTLKRAGVPFSLDEEDATIHLDLAVSSL